jgi:hypothetical protein
MPLFSSFLDDGVKGVFFIPSLALKTGRSISNRKFFGVFCYGVRRFFEGRVGGYINMERGEVGRL